VVTGQSRGSRGAVAGRLSDHSEICKPTKSDGISVHNLSLTIIYLSGMRTADCSNDSHSKGQRQLNSQSPYIEGDLSIGVDGLLFCYIYREVVLPLYGVTDCRVAGNHRGPL
jgi:hypothetical protein